MIPDEIAVALPAPVLGAWQVRDWPRKQVWKVLLADQTMLALKISRNDEGGYGREHSKREAEVLTAIGSALVGTHLRASGELADVTWVAVEWVDDPNLWHRFYDVAPGSPEIRQAVRAAAEGARIVACLHAAGWRHGDLQAAHIRGRMNNIRLIDFELAQEPPGQQLSTMIPYRGGLPQMLAPEIAAGLLATKDDETITLSPSAEVFSFGALIIHAWARRWLYDFGVEDTEDMPWADMMQMIASGHLPIEIVRPWPWPALESILASALEHNPGNRPTMVEVANALDDESQHDH